MKNAYASTSGINPHARHAVCGCCGVRGSAGDIGSVSVDLRSKIFDRLIVTSEQAAMFLGAVPEHKPWFPFVQRSDGVVLHLLEKAIQSTVNERCVEICKKCHASLCVEPTAENMNPLPPENSRLMFGNIEASDELSLLERVVISKACMYGTIVKMKTPFKDTAQLAIKGHIITLSHDGPSQFAEVASLPRTHEQLNVAVHFIGSTHQWVARRERILGGDLCPDVFKLRRRVVEKWLRFLVKYNPLYASVVIDEVGLDNLVELQQKVVDSVIISTDSESVEIERQTTSDTARVRPQDGDVCGGSHAVFEEVMVTNNSTCPPDLSESAVVSSFRRLIDATREDAGEPVKVHVNTKEPMSEFDDNDRIILGAFPFLFPFGTGIREGCGSVPKSLCVHLMRFHDGRFQKNSQFLFLMFNQIQRHSSSRVVSLRLKKHPDEVIDIFSKINDDDFEKQVIFADENPFTDEAREMRAFCDKYISVCGARVPYSPAERKNCLWEILSLLQFYGLPSFFVTVSPVDIDDRVTLRLSSRFEESNEVDGIDITFPASSEVRAAIVNGNPGHAAQQFHKIVDAFCTSLLGVPLSNRKSASMDLRQRGIFGHTRSHYAVFEAQGRGSLHFHMLLWAGISPHLLESILHHPELLAKACAAVDAVVRSSLPAEVLQKVEATREKHRNDGFQSTKSYRGPLVDIVRKEGPELYERVLAVTAANQCHMHTPTCEKGAVNAKCGDEMHCRLAYGQAQFPPPGSGLPQASTVCTLKRNGADIIEILHPTPPTAASMIAKLTDPFLTFHPDDALHVWETHRPPGCEMVVPSSDTVANCCGCNQSQQFLGSAEPALSVVHYLGDYMVKDAQPLTNSLTCMREATKTTKLFPSRAPDAGTPVRESVRIMTRLLNNLTGAIEVSSQTAAACVMGYPSSVASDEFAYCFAWSIVAHALGTVTLVPAFDDEGSSEGNDAHEPDVFMTGVDDTDDFNEKSDVSDEGGNDDTGNVFNIPDTDDIHIAALEGGANGSTSLQAIDGAIVAVCQKTNFLESGALKMLFSFYEYVALILPKKVAEAPSASDEPKAPGEPSRKKNGMFPFDPPRGKHVQALRSKQVIGILCGRPPPAHPGIQGCDESREVFMGRANEWARYIVCVFLPWTEEGSPMFSVGDPRIYSMLVEWGCRVRDASDATFEDKGRLHLIRNVGLLSRVSQQRRSILTQWRFRNVDTWTKTSGPGDIDASTAASAASYIAQIRAATETTAFEPSPAQVRFVQDSMTSLNDVMPSISERAADADRPQSVGVLSAATLKKEMQKTKAYTAPQSAPKKKTDDHHKAKKMRLPAETDEEFVKIVEGELMTPFGLAYKAEQRAFLLACAASFRNGIPMKRFLMGGPGTGKSFVAEGVGVLHQKMTDRDCVYIAPTGVAATQLPIGFTYHTELSISERNEKAGVKKKKGAPRVLRDVHRDELIRKRAKYASVGLIILDEVSMVSHFEFCAIQSRCRLFSEKNYDFGGMHFLMLGDFFQLDPCFGEPLYDARAVINGKPVSAIQASANALFASFETTLLHEQVRADGDRVQCDILENVRLDVPHPITPAMLREYKFLSASDFKENDDFAFAPIVVTSNKQRYAINLAQAIRFGTQRGVPVLRWRDAPAVNKRIRVELPQSVLEKLYRKHEDELFGLFVEGAPGVCLANVNPQLGIANGTPIEHQQIVYNDPKTAIAFKKMCQEAKPGQVVDVQMPDSIRVQRRDVSKRDKRPNEPFFVPFISVNVSTGRKQTKSFRKLAVDLAFAITFYKVQGITAARILLDLNPTPGSMKKLDLQALYVGLSRCTRTTHIRLLPLHPGASFSHVYAFKSSSLLHQFLRRTTTTAAGPRRTTTTAAGPPPTTTTAASPAVAPVGLLVVDTIRKEKERACELHVPVVNVAVVDHADSLGLGVGVMAVSETESSAFALKRREMDEEIDALTVVRENGVKLGCEEEFVYVLRRLVELHAQRQNMEV